MRRLDSLFKNIRAPKSCFALAFFLLITPFALASISEGNSGMLFGNDHAFYFTAAPGWVLDNQSGVNQGVHMAFYPKGYTWSNSPAIAYGRSVTKDERIQTIADLVNDTVSSFKANGSPNYKARRGNSITLPNNQKIEIYFYEGDKWGNYEAVGYIEEKRTINFLVYNAKSREAFEKHWIAIQRILQSYKNAYRNSPEIDNESFEKLIKAAKKDISTNKGKEYEITVIRNFGEAMANYMRDCISYIPQNEVKNFDILFRITPSGKVSESFIRPVTSLSVCFEGLVLNSKHPPHAFDSFLQHLDMKISD